MPKKKIYPARSESDLLLFESAAACTAFVESERGRAHGFRALKPRPIYGWNPDTKKKQAIYTSEPNAGSLLTDDQLADALAKLRSYRHGDDGHKRDGARIMVAKASNRAKEYQTPHAFAPNYPDVAGANITVSRSTSTRHWKKRLADPELRPGYAKITVRLTGEHLPKGTPPKWGVKKVDTNAWQITTPNPYVYEEQDHD